MFKKIFSVFCVLTAVGTINAFAAEYYVDSAKGSDKASGNAAEPFKTIQHAADIVEPGDTVIVNPGIYYENVTLKRVGTEDKPIVFRAAEYGLNKTIITGADRAIRENPNKDIWKLEDEKLQIYSTPLKRSNMAMRCLYNGVDMHMYTTYEGLCKRQSIPDDSNRHQEGYKHGYFMDVENDKLYVRLREDEKYGSVNPNLNTIAISKEKNLTYIDEKGVSRVVKQGAAINETSYNFGVVTEKPSYVAICGFTFETPGFTGVYVRGSYVTVSDCWFRGCACGVKGGARFADDKFSSDYVNVQYCDYTQFPTFEDAVELVNEKWNDPITKKASLFWFQKKQTSRLVTGLSGYYSYETGGFVGNMGDHWNVRNSYIYSVLDGMSWFANWKYDELYEDGVTYREQPSAYNNIYENRFERCVDNCIEVEFNSHGYDIHHNEFFNSFEPFSLQTGRGKPWPTNSKFHHNILYNSYSYARNWFECTATGKDNYAARMCNFLKIGVPTSDYKSPKPWMMEESWNYDTDMPYDTVYLEDKGYELYNNTFVGPYTFFMNSIGIFGENGDANFRLKNNIFVGMAKYDNNSRVWLKIGQVGDGIKGWQYNTNLYAPYYDSEHADMFPKIDTDDTFFNNGGILTDIEKIGFKDMKNYNFELSFDSIARGKGTAILGEDESVKDLGAVPYGETFSIRYAPHAYGDINCDGVIDNRDTALVLKNVGTKEGDKNYDARCDVDFNGKVDENDVAVTAAQKDKNGGKKFEDFTGVVYEIYK